MTILDFETEASAQTTDPFQPGPFALMGESDVGGTLLVQRRRRSDGETWDDMHSESVTADTYVLLVFEFDPGFVRFRFTPDSSATFNFEAESLS